MISRLRSSSTTEKAFVEILSLVVNNIGWEQLMTKYPMTILLLSKLELI